MESGMPAKMMSSRQVQFSVVAVIIVLLFFVVGDFGPTKLGTRFGSGSVLVNRLPEGETIWGMSKELPKDQYMIGIVSDLDKRSAITGKKPSWYSWFRTGVIKKVDRDGTEAWEVEWKDTKKLVTGIGEKGRGMELSELTAYNDMLLSFDDRTGIVYQVTKDYKAVPRYILTEGDGYTNKGQKTEWATVKDGKLYVGSFGKEYTTPDGKTVQNTNNMWIKIIDGAGHIEHVDWTKQYNALRAATGSVFPGYMIIEAIEWDWINKRWVCLPRRVSTESYDETLDEKRGSNKVIFASEDFRDVTVREVGTLTPERGFSSFKFLPDTKKQGCGCVEVGGERCSRHADCAPMHHQLGDWGVFDARDRDRWGVQVRRA
jgi:soluble calcium-activated nucleotidase 1